MSPRAIRRLAGQIGWWRMLATATLLLAALLVARGSWSLPFARDAERAMYDTRTWLTAPRTAQDNRVALVTYTDDTLQQTARRSPLDRGLLARALTQIDRLGARVIGIDILIDEPQAEDAQLVAALRGMRTPTFLAFATNASNPHSMPYWQEQVERGFFARLSGSNVHPASVLFSPDSDGVVRSWPEAPAGTPLLATRLAGDRLVARPYHSIAWRLPRDPERGVFASLPIDLFASDMGARLLAGQIRGRAVLVGGDISDEDRFDTPVSRFNDAPRPQADTGSSATGLQIHAVMLAQLLDHRLLRRFGVGSLWLAAAAVVAGGALAGSADVAGWRLALVLALSLVVIVALPVALQALNVDTQRLPGFGWLVGWTLAYSAAAAAARGVGSEQRRFAQGALGKYLPPEVAAQILRDPEQLRLHGERTTIFALFSDLEGFTKLTHSVAPETIASLLNRYLDTLSGIVLAHGGTVDKFVGDAIVAFWGAPIARADDGDRALAAVLAIVAAGEAFRRERTPGVPPLGRTRVGLHRGEAIVGNFGGEGRMQYTALGDAMNAAARLEGANKALATCALVSEAAAAAMTDPPLRPMGRVQLRGRSTPVTVFEPVPEQSDDERRTLAAVVARFEAGDDAALADLDRFAAPRGEDAALASLRERLVTAGPGGCVALD